MDPELRERWIHAMMDLRKFRPPFGIKTTLAPGELMTLHRIAHMQFRAENNIGEDSDLSISDIREDLDVSKPAVSQVLNALEKKELVTREISREDRRKIIVRLTPKGDALLLEFRRQSDMLLDSVIERFGVPNMREFLDSFEELMSIFYDLRDSVERSDV